jgi:hypothetical protein
MRVRDSKSVIFSILFGVSLLLPASIGAEETQQSSDWIPRESDHAVRSGGSESHTYTDWSRFRRILVHPVGVAHTMEFKEAGLTEYPNQFDSEDLERVRRYFKRAFQRQLGRYYPLTTEPGEDVLRVDAVLVDPMLDKTWWLQPGKYVLRGEAGVTLVVVLRDSETGAALHRVNLPLRVGSLGFQSSAVNYWGYLRLIFDRVAARVHWSLHDAPGSTRSIAISPTSVRAGAKTAIR